jgi:hypothetical protein
LPPAAVIARREATKRSSLCGERESGLLRRLLRLAMTTFDKARPAAFPLTGRAIVFGTPARLSALGRNANIPSDSTLRHAGGR